MLSEFVSYYIYLKTRLDRLINFKAYSQSIGLGLSTCLAILFHEIPHELGDFAVLRGAGFSHCGVLLLNSISSFCAMVAFLIIAALEPDEQVRQWIFAVVAGVFLYIAMANIVSFNRENSFRQVIFTFFKKDTGSKERIRAENDRQSREEREKENSDNNWRVHSRLADHATNRSVRRRPHD